MTLKRIIALRQQISYRLISWYAVTLILLFTIAFVIFFPYAARSLERRTEKDLYDELEEFVGIYNSRGQPALTEEFMQEVKALGASNISQSILDAEGGIVFTSDAPSWKNLPVHREMLKQALGQITPVIATITVPKFSHKVRIAYRRLSRDKVLRLGLLLRYDENFLEGLRKILITTMAVILGIVLLVCWIILKQVTDRVVTVTNTALSISSHSLNQRVPVSSQDDEIDRLAQAFNGMLDRIEALVRGQQEVTDNVAHDLKIPLARIRILAESLATTSADRNETQEMEGSIIEECDRLLEMINTTHEIKAIETGIAVWDFAKVDIAEVVRQACELFLLVAEDKKISLEVKQLPSYTIKGDLRRLQRVFANLLDNAVKYTSAEGKITVSMDVSTDEAKIRICDTGIGIDPEELLHIFERFYRSDKSRSTSGLGLGLSLVQTIIQAHGGKIEVQSTVGVGSIFTITLLGYRRTS
jgi:signal transduction histidine kinase